MRDDKRFGVAQFMRDSILLRDTADRNSMPSRNELGCIVDYLATMYFCIYFNFIFLFFAFLYSVYDLIINK